MSVIGRKKEVKMSLNAKILISAVGVAALLAAPAVAKPRAAHHHAVPRAAYARAPYVAGPGSPLPSGVYYNKILPYSETIITGPDGRYAGTDPDPRIRADLRRGGGGTNSASGSNPSQ
jgi:hypothetical protein